MLHRLCTYGKEVKIKSGSKRRVSFLGVPQKGSARSVVQSGVV